jgi:hypothetical protein
MPALQAATSTTVDILSNDAADARDTIDIGGVKPLANRERGKPLPRKPAVAGAARR